MTDKESLLGFYSRLGADWEDLADLLEIPRAEQRRFEQGKEPRRIWEWLENRERLGILPKALAAIRRQDLVPLIQPHISVADNRSPSVNRDLLKLVSDSILGDLSYSPKEHYWCLKVGWQLGRLELLAARSGSIDDDIDEDTQEAVERAALNELEDFRKTLAEVGLSMPDKLRWFDDPLETLRKDAAKRYSAEHEAFILVGIAGLRLSMASAASNVARQEEMRWLAGSCLTAITGVYVADKEALFNRMAGASVDFPGALGDLLMKIQRERTQPDENPPQTGQQKITVLFAAADPTDASRLRLGEELRNIQQMLQIARYRDQYNLVTRTAMRVQDLTQAILDEKPRIFHFSGHGTAVGAICLEDVNGRTHEVDPEALASLFRVAKGVECVLLNACFSGIQAAAIARVVPYVIGMKKEIGDPAAIAFSRGFYQALGAGRSIPDAYEFGIVQLDLSNIPESLTPELLS